MAPSPLHAAPAAATYLQGGLLRPLRAQSACPLGSKDLLSEPQNTGWYDTGVVEDRRQNK